jgi:DNA primase
VTLSPQWLDELRARTVLSAVIAPTVKLIRAGREWKACCPFHNEKTPSFTVNDDKGFYHCFGCGAHGDAIRFLTDQRGMPFMDAVKELAGKAGLEVPAPDPQAKERADRAASLTDVMAEVARYYTEQLDGLAGADARDYLKHRGIDPGTAQRFGLGLAADSRNALKRALAKLGEDKLVETGMLIKPDDGGQTYDRFRGRLMFPVRDARGRVIAFGGRILGDGEPKYLNSPDTVLFDKGRTLYNIDRASPASRTAKRLIVVEGYMDVIALDRAGIEEVVAPNGTAVTEAQLERMWRLDPSPILCFDGDAAGQKAAIRAALRALPHLRPDRTLRFVELPAGQDPDDVVKSGGREAFETLLAAAEPLDARLWRHELAAAPLGTPEAWAGLKQRLVDHAAAIGHPDLARMYREDWLNRFYALRRPERPQQERRPFVKGARWTPPEPPVGATPRKLSASGIDPMMIPPLLAGCIRFPQTLVEHFETISALPIADPRLAGLRDLLLREIATRPSLESADLKATLDASELAALVGTLLRADGMNFSFNQSNMPAERAVEDFDAVLRTLVEKRQLEDRLKEATRELGADTTDAKLERQMSIRQTLRTLDERLASLAGTD